MESLHFKRGSQRFWSLEGWASFVWKPIPAEARWIHVAIRLWIFSKGFHVHCLLILTSLRTSRNLTSRPLEQ